MFSVSMPVMLGHLYTSYVLLNAHWSAFDNLITLFSYDDQAHFYDISVSGHQLISSYVIVDYMCQSMVLLESMTRWSFRSGRQGGRCSGDTHSGWMTLHVRN